MPAETPSWYLIRTKPQKERWVADQLSPILTEVFLPMLKAKTPRWGRMAVSVGPLFPCYLFARFDLGVSYFDIKYMQGVRGLVSAGSDPIVVPCAIIDEIRRRAKDGVVEIPATALVKGQSVKIVEGPFRGLEAIFERYLSGNERVALLLGAIGAGSVRMVLPADAVAKSS